MPPRQVHGAAQPAEPEQPAQPARLVLADIVNKYAKGIKEAAQKEEAAAKKQKEVAATLEKEVTDFNRQETAADNGNFEGLLAAMERRIIARMDVGFYNARLQSKVHDQWSTARAFNGYCLPEDKLQPLVCREQPLPAGAAIPADVEMPPVPAGFPESANDIGTLSDDDRRRMLLQWGFEVQEDASSRVLAHLFNSHIGRLGR